MARGAEGAVDVLEVLARGSDTGGAFGVFEFRHGEIAENPPHAHLGFDKVIYVLECEYDVRVGDVESSVGPGSLVVVPRGAHHAFTTTGGRMLFVCTPSGNEEMFIEMGELEPAAAPDDVAAIAAKWQMVPPAGAAAEPWRPAR